MKTDVRRNTSSTQQDALRNDIAAIRARLEGLQSVSQERFVPTAETVCSARTAFALSEFETSFLTLGAAVELDTEIASLCGRLSQQDGSSGAHFALASRVFADAHWSALLPTGPLRYWRLMEVEPRRDAPLTHSRFKISERTLHHLLGLVYLDDSLHPLLSACRSDHELWPAHEAVATRISRVLSMHPDSALVVTGGDARSRRSVVARACGDLEMRLFALRGEDVPADPVERDRFARAWMRESLFSPAVLLVEGGTAAAVTALADRLGTALAVSANDGVPDGNRSFVRLQLSSPTPDARKARWRVALGERARTLDGTVDALAAQFDLTPGQIDAAIDSAEEETPQGLWQASRLQGRPAFGELARRIEPSATWDDLVLPPAQTGVLKQIAMHVRQRLRVYEDWGFGANQRGLGITALFAGVSGTGKTMAGEVLATDLQLDLYRIDLSQVVSKYIGETEKNLGAVFDAADAGSVILLFDEADALFGRRSEVKDSHDRYANIEISYLLQRMEEYRGLAILTTNQRAALDNAFLRRLRFVVEFPFPDSAARTEIWRRVFPAMTPVEGLDSTKLARLNVAGGHIRNIAMNAAFLAADGSRSVRMSDVLQAARTELAKTDKTPSDAEVHDWVR
jgi:hypothetical protein